MKLTKKMTMFLTTLALSSTMAFAEGGVGNGGVSVVCRDDAKNITSAQLLDTYEGEARFGKTYDDGLNLDTMVKTLELNLKDNIVFFKMLKREMAKVQAAMVYVSEDNVLTPTNDAFPVMVKKGCDFEQLANYADEEILVSSEIYKKLENKDIVALIVHEAVYSMFRRAGEKDSRQARRFTAEILSQNPNDTKVTEILTKFGVPFLSATTTLSSANFNDSDIQNARKANATYEFITTNLNGISTTKVGLVKCIRKTKKQVECVSTFKPSYEFTPMVFVINDYEKTVAITLKNGETIESNLKNDLDL